MELSGNPDAEKISLQAENHALRAIVAAAPWIPCIYCSAPTMAQCPRGFPGCAQADDLMVSGDEHLRATLDAKNAQIAEVDEIREDLCNMLVWAELYLAYTANYSKNLPILDRLEAVFHYRPSP